METEKGLEQHGNFRAEIHDASRTSWDDIRQRVSEIDLACFGDNSLHRPYLEAFFSDPENVSVLLRNQTNIIVGFSIAMPDPDEQAMHIALTAIDLAFQKQKGVGKIMEVLEKEIKTRGIPYLTRDAMIANGYADAIARHYGERIVGSHERRSKYGPQRHFKIKL